MSNNSFTFNDGVLHLQTQLEECRLRWMPKPLAEKKNYRGEWKECWPEFRILRPALAGKSPYEIDVARGVDDRLFHEQKQAAFQAFRSLIPVELVAITEPFASHQWILLKLLHDEAAFLDLARANPVLAYGLANNHEMRGTKPEAGAFQAVCYCHRKQRDILKWLGFPGSDAMVRFFKRVRPESASPSMLRRIQTAIQNDGNALECLAHYPRINAGMLMWVIDRVLTGLSTPKLLNEVAENPDDMHTAATAGALQDALCLMKEFAPARTIPPFTRIAQIHDFQKTVDIEYQDYRKRKDEERKHPPPHPPRAAPSPKPQPRPFPEPPLPGIDGIVPLISPLELRLEGQAQHNCVETYKTRVKKGEIYIYKVMWPERATLSIVKGADGCWTRGELKKAGNGQVRSATRRFVDNWLEKTRISV